MDTSILPRKRSLAARLARLVAVLILFARGAVAAEPPPAGPVRPAAYVPGPGLGPGPVRWGTSDLEATPGMPPGGRRPRPGVGLVNPLDPGATGSGINPSSREPFLQGALDPRTGWPFVWMDHFRPRPERVARFWIVQTRACPQELGSDPFACLRVLHFGPRGELVEHDVRELFAQAVGHPVLIQVQGNLTTPDVALGGLLWSHSWLEMNRVLPPDAVVVAFDWPSQRVYHSDLRDVDEKARRAFVAAYHLARFVQGFPPASRICLLGHSFGGRVVPSALHLLGGGCLDDKAPHTPPVRLPGPRPDLHLRAIVLAGASDHRWLDPGAPLDRALVACEGLLNLYNRRDEALILYPLLWRSDHHRALGRVGLTPKDLERLGPLAARYAEFDVHDVLGLEHSLVDAVSNREVARRMAPYLWMPDPGPAPPGHPTANEPDEDRRGLFRFRGNVRDR